MSEIYVAASRSKLVSIGKRLIAEFSGEGGEVDVVWDAEKDGELCLLHFNNEDMQRPEVADIILVETIED
jgi:hypothetical protein